jgi:hypothetical protein
MSSVGEISLLYMNKAHVMDGSLVTRRMMLIYMASTIFSMISTPLLLRAFVPAEKMVHAEAVAGGVRYERVVGEIIRSDVEFAGLAGGMSRRKKDHTSDEDRREDSMV